MCPENIRLGDCRALATWTTFHRFEATGVVAPASIGRSDSGPASSW